MAKKVMSTDNLGVIKDFILSNLMLESDNIRRELTDENAEYIQNKIELAKVSLTMDYTSKYNDLTAELNDLRENGADTDQIRELELLIDALEKISKTNRLH